MLGLIPVTGRGSVFRQERVSHRMLVLVAGPYSRNVADSLVGLENRMGAGHNRDARADGSTT